MDYTHSSLKIRSGILNKLADLYMHQFSPLRISSITSLSTSTSLLSLSWQQFFSVYDISWI